MKYRVELKAAIVDEGRRQNWLADKVGVDPAILSHWIAGNRSPNAEQRKALAKLLNRKVKDLFPEE